MTTWEAAAEKTYRAIGRFVFEFSQAEYAIRYYLAEEIKLDEKHFSAVVESYDVGLLCTVAIHVFNQSRRADNASQIEKLIKKFRAFNDERNRVAHGLWVPSQDGGTVHYVPRSNPKTNSFSEQAAFLEKRAAEVNALRFELEAAFARIF
jgi:hypothetical protein